MTWVLCSGMIRSGSTLQYQLASSIVEYENHGHRLPYTPELAIKNVLDFHEEEPGFKVVKVHVCTFDLANFVKQRNAKIVYCYRDIRDVAVSAMRKFDISFDELIDAKWLDQAITDYNEWVTMPDVLISRYEEIIVDLGKEATRISSFLGLKFNTGVLRRIADQYEMPAQKQRIHKLKQRHGLKIDGNAIIFDEDELLHHNHIYRGEVGGWRYLLAPHQQDLLTDRYKPWLLSLGYGV